MQNSNSFKRYITTVIEETVREVLNNSDYAVKRRKLVVANWKMNMTLESIEEFIKDFVLEDVKVDVVISPPFPFLYPVNLLAEKYKREFFLGAQDVHWEEKGAYTGEVSTSILSELDCKYVIIGHSERRAAGESDEIVKLKAKKTLSSGMIPIICVGETEEQRAQGKTNLVVEEQVIHALDNLSEEEVSRVVIAYEPVWAIGTGESATPGQAQQVHEVIRKVIADRFNAVSEEVPILYGGSVKPENAQKFSGMDDIDGALVGGASLDALNLSRIVRAFERS